MRVQHRHVVFVQGFDPRGVAQYYRSFRTELRKFGRLYKLTTHISRPQSAPTNDKTTSWTIETKASDWHCRTSFDFLHWDDLIQRELAAPGWRTVFRGTWIYGLAVFRGTIARFWRAQWRFAIFCSYPYALLFIEALFSLVLAFSFAKGIEALGVTGLFRVAAAATVFIAAIGIILKYTEDRTYLLYLISDWIWTWEFSHGRRPDWDERIDRFAEYLVNVARTSHADEIVVVGHSSGSFLSTEILARALELDPALGRHGAHVILLTIGGNLPIVGFHAASDQFRDHLRLLAIERSIDWVDCQCRNDIMNFYRFDPIVGHDIDVCGLRRNPTIVWIRFGRIVKPEHYKLFRWMFFRVHFQFIMANELPYPYDFFMIVCGPIGLKHRIACPHAAFMIATADGDARESAWKSLETTVELSGSTIASLLW